MMLDEIMKKARERRHTLITERGHRVEVIYYDEVKSFVKDILKILGEEYLLEPVGGDNGSQG